MECLECGKAVRAVSYAHLRCCSGITPADYKARYPGTPLMDDDVRRASELLMERNPNWRGGRTYKVCQVCGLPIARNAKQMCLRCRRLTGPDNPFYGRRHTELSRERMSAAQQQRDPMTRHRLKPSSETLGQARARWWAGVPQDQRADRLGAFIAAGQLHNKRAAKTRIENLVADMLNRLDATYEQNVQLGRYNVDFLIGSSVVVECYGDY